MMDLVRKWAGGGIVQMGKGKPGGGGGGGTGRRTLCDSDSWEK